MKNIQVVIAAFVKNQRPINDGIVLIEKKRPGWMHGLWNLPGGHVEDNETPEDAARREFEEEVGIKPRHLLFVGDMMPNPQVGLYVYATELQEPLDLITVRANAAAARTGEPIIIQTVGNAMTNALLLPDLYFVIPECLKAINEWKPPTMGMVPRWARRGPCTIQHAPDTSRGDAAFCVVVDTGTDLGGGGIAGPYPTYKEALDFKPTGDYGDNPILIQRVLADGTAKTLACWNAKGQNWEFAK